MKVSFDGLRKNIAADFNNLALQISTNTTDNKVYTVDNEFYLNKLRSSLGALMACYDSEQMPDDFNDLSGEIKLLEL